MKKPLKTHLYSNIMRYNYPIIGGNGRGVVLPVPPVPCDPPRTGGAISFASGAVVVEVAVELVGLNILIFLDTEEKTILEDITEANADDIIYYTILLIWKIICCCYFTEPVSF
jgi:hypothetical protein